MATFQTRSYTLPGVDGGTLTYTFVWKNLGDAGVRTDGSMSLRYKGNRSCLPPYGYIDPNNPADSALFISVSNDAACSDEANGVGLLFNPVVLHKIILPNGQAYTFTYNRFGEIDKVVMPTGGFEKFSYAYVEGIGSTIDHQFYGQMNRGVVMRSVSDDGGPATRDWHYTAGHLQALGPYITTVTDPDNVRTERLVHEGAGSDTIFGFETTVAGRAYEERVYEKNNGPMLRRTLTKWIATSAQYPNSGYNAESDARVAKQVSFMLDTAGTNALGMLTTMAYDNDLNVVETKTYDYVSLDKATAQTITMADIESGGNSTGALLASRLLRTEETLFWVNDISVTNRSAYRDRQMLALPSVSRVKDPSGTIVAETQYLYDTEDLVLTDTTLPQSPVTWVDPGLIRGNLTKVRRWLNASADGNTVAACALPQTCSVNERCLCTNGTWLETRSQYDQLGNLRKSWDAKGNLSEITYDSVSNYAYPLETKSPAPGGNGSATPLTTSMTYDKVSGKMLTSTDANGKVTTYVYKDSSTPLDPLHRLQRVEMQDNLGKVKYEFNDSPGSLSVKALTLQSETTVGQTTVFVWLEDTTLFDGLGRVKRSLHKEVGNSSAKDTEYDVMGRVKRVSNPYFNTGSPTEWTTTTYDSLGRVTEVKTPDNAVVTTVYNNNEVTVTDQDGKQRRSVTDGLGRLVRVFEAPNSVNYRTDYTYDVLGNLTQVRQGGLPTSSPGNPVQFRRFFYDSLSRLGSGSAG